jgi:hypothetical protein
LEVKKGMNLLEKESFLGVKIKYTYKVTSFVTESLFTPTKELYNSHILNSGVIQSIIFFY